MSNESILYHIVLADYYDSLPADQPYVPPRFAEEGFIHCTKGEDRLLLVANTVYRKMPGKFWLLVIDEHKVKPEIRYEIVGEIVFPHIYGPLNRDAIVRVQEMARAADGTFLTIGAPPEPSEPLSVHPAALAAHATIEDVLAETRRLRHVATERIAALEQEIEAFRQGRPAPAGQPVSAAPAAPSALAITPGPGDVERLAGQISRVEQQLVELNALIVNRLDKLEARVKALEKKRAPSPRQPTRKKAQPR